MKLIFAVLYVPLNDGPYTLLQNGSFFTFYQVTKSFIKNLQPVGEINVKNETRTDNIHKSNTIHRKMSYCREAVFWKSFGEYLTTCPMSISKEKDINKKSQ